MKKLLLFFIAIICIQNIQAQTRILFNESTSNPLLPLKIKSTEAGKIKGSAYYKEWLPGSVVVKNKLYESVLVRYNAYNQWVDVKSKNDGEGSFEAPMLSSFTLFTEEQELIFKSGFKFKHTTLDQKTYFNVLYDAPNEISLLRYISVKYVEQKNEVGFGGSELEKSTSFERNETDYFLKDGNLIPVKRSKKAILKSLQEFENELKTFIKDKNLVLKEDHDLVRLLQYYTQLKKNS